ncbi:MAG: thiamine biosynthesis protein ThiS [Candidatus Pelagibacter sp.]|nr:thiamine biosynthesis protein ThiS [Candidatus Pelagibacter sp.]|tara:strand:+ start:3964 stop:4167 length:204 start_codon:yes stop_codon:yes gene_type:complete
MAKIQLNGKKITVKQKISLFELLRKYKLDKKKVAVELNGSIILKKLYKKKLLSENDKIEIVHFIGGG